MNKEIFKKSVKAMCKMINLKYHFAEDRIYLYPRHLGVLYPVRLRYALKENKVFLIDGKQNPPYPLYTHEKILTDVIPHINNRIPPT